MSLVTFKLGLLRNLTMDKSFDHIFREHSLRRVCSSGSRASTCCRHVSSPTCWPCYSQDGVHGTWLPGHGGRSDHLRSSSQSEMAPAQKVSATNTLTTLINTKCRHMCFSAEYQLGIQCGLCLLYHFTEAWRRGKACKKSEGKRQWIPVGTQ